MSILATTTSSFSVKCSASSSHSGNRARLSLLHGASIEIYQIKSNHFYCHITTEQVPWWVKFLRACSRQCKKTTIYIWTVHIYRLYRRQCAKYTYIYSVHIVYYKDILSYQLHIIHIIYSVYVFKMFMFNVFTRILIYLQRCNHTLIYKCLINTEIQNYSQLLVQTHKSMISSWSVLTFEVLTEQDNDVFIMVKSHFFKVHPNQLFHRPCVPVSRNWLTLQLRL